MAFLVSRFPAAGQDLAHPVLLQKNASFVSFHLKKARSRVYSKGHHTKMAFTRRKIRDREVEDGGQNHHVLLLYGDRIDHLLDHFVCRRLSNVLAPAS